MKRRLSVFLLAVMATFVFAGCSSNDPVKTTPEAVPATQVPNDADQGGGAGGTNDENNDGTPDSTPDPDERVEDGLAAVQVAGYMDDIKQDVENGVDDVKDDVEQGVDDVKRGIDDAADKAQDEMNRMKDEASESMK